MPNSETPEGVGAEGFLGPRPWDLGVFWGKDLIFGRKNWIFGREPEILTEKKRGFLREELGLKHWTQLEEVDEGLVWSSKDCDSLSNDQVDSGCKKDKTFMKSSSRIKNNN